MNRLIYVLIVMFAVSAPAIAQQGTANHPVTILISIDGFRPDYLDQGNTPNLDRIKAQGVSSAMRPSFPTKTFPNHYTLVTGMRPDHHGMVGNNIIDPRRPGEMFSLGNARQSLDPFWWDEAEPLWVTAEKAGVRTATMFWPGSEVAIHGVRPSDWLRFDANISNVQRVNTILDWMRRPDEIRPQFITLYFDTVDMASHMYGPRSNEALAAVAEVDARLGELVTGIEKSGLAVNIVIVSDHGMAEIDASRVIQLHDFIDAESMLIVDAGTFAAIEPVTGTDERVAEALLKPHDHMACYRKADIPERLAYGKNARVAAIFCLAESGWSILAGDPRYPVKGGNHGYDNDDPEMRALFIAAGPSINPNATISLFDNVHVYPLLAKLVGIEPLPSDGDAAVLAESIVKSIN